jgi:hypothetical protein
MSYDKRPATQFMSTKAFHDGFFAYDENTGLHPVLGAGPGQCPAGRVLRETGKKLYPGIHASVKTIMTGVYDSITNLSGFIDSNSAIFTLFAINHAPDQPSGLDYNPRGVNQAGVSHKGQSVYTLGDVVAGGQFYTIKTQDLGSEAFINGDFSTTSYYTITLTQDTQLNALIVPPNKGTVIYVSVKGNGISTLFFGTNFTGSIGQIKPESNNEITISFISNGTVLASMSQSDKGIAPIYQVVTFAPP